MTLRLLGLAATIAFLGAAVQPAAAAFSSVDRAFVTTAGQGGAGEVADGKLALAKTPTEPMRVLAQRIISDHTAVDAQLGAIASARGMTVPMDPGPADVAAMEQQQRLTGAAFSAAYLHDQEVAHEQTIALFRHEAVAGSDPQLVAFAKANLPAIEHYLMLIRSARGGA